MWKTLCSATICVLLGAAGTTQAEEPEFDRLTGRLGLGVMLINSGNNLNPSGSKAFLTDLNSSADKELSTLPIPLPAATYDVGAQEGIKLYFNTRPPIDEVGSFALNLGANYPMDFGILDIRAFFTPFLEVWQDPYITGVDRQETSTSKYGALLGLNRIAGSGLRMSVVYMNDDVDEDLIADRFPSLARDGGIYAFNANYSFFFSKSFELRPRLSVRKGDYDGGSNSFTKYKVDLEARYVIGRLMLMPRLSYSRIDYDETHPIFNMTRKDDGYGVSLMLNYMAPFGWQDWSAQSMLGFSRGDSNITFYDTEAVNVGLFMTYHF